MVPLWAKGESWLVKESCRYHKIIIDFYTRYYGVDDEDQKGLKRIWGQIFEKSYWMGSSHLLLHQWKKKFGKPWLRDLTFKSATNFIGRVAVKFVRAHKNARSYFCTRGQNCTKINLHEGSLLHEQTILHGDNFVCVEFFFYFF